MINSEDIKKGTRLIVGDMEFDNPGLVNSDKYNTLSFIDDANFIPALIENKNIKGIFVNEEIADRITKKDLIKIVVSDARYYFYILYNYIAKKNFVKTKSIISKKAKIAGSAIISEYNVEIGDDVIIDELAVVKPDVYIKDNTSIGAMCVLGCEGNELKRTKEGIISVIHDGKLKIGSNVHIGDQSSIYKGFSFRDTVIGDWTKIDNQVWLAHCVHVGEGCFILGQAKISGSSTIGNNVWIGPGAVISNQISIGDNARISLGAVVTKNVEEGKAVSGNFAIEHSRFLDFIKKIK